MPEPSGTGTLQSRGLNPLPATTALTLLLQLLSVASGGSPDLLMEQRRDFTKSNGK